MGFRKLTRLRNEYLEKKKRETMELPLEEFGKLFGFRHSVKIIVALSGGPMTAGEIRKFAFNSYQYNFLQRAKRMGVVERYYDKKEKKHYYRLVPRVIKVSIGEKSE